MYSSIYIHTYTYIYIYIYIYTYTCIPTSIYIERDDAIYTIYTVPTMAVPYGNSRDIEYIQHTIVHYCP